MSLFKYPQLLKFNLRITQILLLKLNFQPYINNSLCYYEFVCSKVKN